MRITFRRFPGHTTAYSIIERDDGVVYRMQEFTAPGAKLPHDLRHLVVERELRIADGVWGAIAAGVVYTSMEHVRGRRPPDPAEAAAVPPPAAVAGAARALQVEAARWARLRVGEELVYSWPAATTRALRAVPQPREAGDRRNPRRAGKRDPR